MGQPFDRTTGGGITLSNLFEGWPRDRLAAAVVTDAHLAFDVCERFYVLGHDEITWAWPLSLVGRTETPASRADAVETTRTRESSAEASGEPAQGPGIAKRAFRSAVEGLGVGDSLRSMHVSTGLRAWIAAFQPDVVYSQLSDLPVMTLVSEILDETRLPFVLHMMDDWPSSMYRLGVLGRVPRAQADRLFASLLSRAAARLAIGDAMAEEYRRRYGVTFTPVQNAVDIARRDALAALHRSEYGRRAGTPLSIVYAGRVGKANAQSLMDVAGAVSGLVATDTPATLTLYTGSADRELTGRMSGMAGVCVRPAVPYDHVPALLEAADVLLMPLDFDEESLRFSRLSMPTKIPEYMAAGRPVLTYAPRGGAAAEYARDGGWSVLVDEPECGPLRDALISLAEDPISRESMGKRGRAVAIDRHDAVNVRAHFAEELARAASTGPVEPS